jgi:hypothetical protein
MAEECREYIMLVRTYEEKRKLEKPRFIWQGNLNPVEINEECQLDKALESLGSIPGCAKNVSPVHSFNTDLPNLLSNWCRGRGVKLTCS